jgi:hypothetical protein
VFWRFCNNSCCLIYRTIAWTKDTESKPVVGRLMTWLIFDNSGLGSVQGYILYCYLDKHGIFFWLVSFILGNQHLSFCLWQCFSTKKTFAGTMLCLLISFTFAIEFHASFLICTRAFSCLKQKESTFMHLLFSTYGRSASPYHKQVSINALCTRYPQLYISSSMVFAKELINLSLQIIRAPLHVLIC